MPLNEKREHVSGVEAEMQAIKCSRLWKTERLTNAGCHPGHTWSKLYRFNIATVALIALVTF
jgi:hypothetical protein